MSRDAARVAVCFLAIFFCSRAASAQAADTSIVRVDLPIGRSYPLVTRSNLTQVSVANPGVADVVVLDVRNVVVNARAPGETDVILWQDGAPISHYRVSVHSPADRQQIVIAVKFAEVRRDFLRNLGVSGLYRDQRTRVGTGTFNTDNVFDKSTGTITLPSTVGFGTVLTDFGTNKLLALLEAEQQRGTARILAEPTVMAANNDSASFLAGGEIPIPVAQNTAGGVPTVTIIWREFGIRLNFVGEIVSDSLIKLRIRPEVSSLDFTNGIELSGFRVPALRTRRVESTLDVRRDQSLIISGLMDDERQEVKTGVPLLSDIPIIGSLFSSTRWQRNETELLVVVTPVVTDPLHPRPRDVIHFAPDTLLPARDAVEPRLPPTPKKP